jgi:lipopolysaccharide transport system ATP-binding protein
MSDVAIRVENLSKQYRIGGLQARYKLMRELLVEAAQAPFRRLASVVRGQSSTVSGEIIWALKDVSFEVKRGEVVGIIGRNGAGKTTLLKILSRITEPTEGYAEIRGRVGSLLEVGTGFHPELTGRENIYLNGAILGMKRAEIEHKFDEMVAFAEIERFIDTPVKHYSSGMYVRLAFAVAAHLEPEILLVDEVLAVGDAAFQTKCLGKMSDVARGGRTVLFVSHNMAAVQSLCSRVLLVDGGRVIADGKPLSIIEQYSSQVQVGSGTFDLTDHPRSGGDGNARIERFRVIDATLRPISSVPMGARVGFEIDYRSSVPLDRADFVIGVYNSLMQRVCQFSSARSGFFVDREVRQGTLRCFVPAVNLTVGRYYLNLAIIGLNRREDYDHLTQAAAFDITEADVFGTGKIPDPLGGSCFFFAEWGSDELMSKQWVV